MNYEAESPEFPACIQNNMRTLRDGGELCDFVVVIEGVELSTHKLVLASCSEYFRAMFHHNTLESQQNKATLHDISVEATTALIDFCYSSKISLNLDNVQDILIAASILQIHQVLSLCVKFIKQNLSVSNCLSTLIVADRCNIADLYSKSLEFCFDQFEKIVEEREFLHLDETWLAKIICDDRLHVENEQKVLTAVIKWWKSNQGGDELCSTSAQGVIQSKLSDLLEHVRFTQMDPPFLISLKNDNLIQSSSRCRDLIEEAKDHLLMKLSNQPVNPTEPECQPLQSQPRYRPRSSLRRKQRIYAVGGWTNEIRPTASVEEYDPYEERWTEVSSMATPKCGVGVAVLDDCLYAVGGHDGQIYLKTIEQYHLSTGQWNLQLANMKSERTSVGVVALDGYIYAIGGQCGSGSSANVERFDPINNRWEHRKPLQDKRLGAGVAVLNGLIYVMGGADEQTLKTVERYNPSDDRWEYVAPMTTNRKHLGAASLNGKVYAVGGRGDNSELNSAECFDPEVGEWVSIPPMREKRSGIGLVQLDGLLYAVGGHNGDIRLNLVEAFDPKTNKWVGKTPMKHERLGGGLAVHSKVMII